MITTLRSGRNFNFEECYVSKVLVLCGSLVPIADKDSSLWLYVQASAPDLTSNEMKLILKSRKLERLMGLKVHQDGFKPTNFVEWLSAVASVT